MATWLLTWKRANDPWGTLPSELKRFRSGESVRQRWSTGTTKRVQVGDRFFLLQQGVKPQRIIASGSVVSSPAEVAHYDPVRAAKGDKYLAVDILFDVLLDPETEGLPRDQLPDGLEGVHWNAQGSGTEIKGEAGEALREAWEKHVAPIASTWAWHADAGATKAMQVRPFAWFEPRIRSLPSTVPLGREDLLTDDFRLFRDGPVEVFYMPSSNVTRDAKVLIVGISPGFTQMELAYRFVRKGLEAGLPAQAARDWAEEQCSFAGSMRTNLVRMLDEIGLAKELEIATCDDLFSSAKHLLNSTSALRHPVFVNGENYTGHHPLVEQSPIFEQCLREILVPDLHVAPDALVIPLGKFVSRVLHQLGDEGLVDTRRCLFGFPHPSGANGHMKRQFEEAKGGLTKKVRDWFAPAPLRRRRVG